jgi:hypothetical protein
MVAVQGSFAFVSVHKVNSMNEMIEVGLCIEKKMHQQFRANKLHSSQILCHRPEGSEMMNRTASSVTLLSMF